MLAQYRLLHRHALGSFRDLLVGMGTDPAMLVWLGVFLTGTDAAAMRYSAVFRRSPPRSLD